jgi:hypothetical protein
MKKKKPLKISFEDTTLTTWFERDRANMNLNNTLDNDNSILSLWDDDVLQAIEDGFLKNGGDHKGMYDLAVNAGLIKKKETT